ncbi:hypothetical protein DXF85_02950 [Citrobacter pasteurii]|uniref:Uncharacterized protein n=1 Tax=Citrobacter pasteurii TaxID=1563222 RepID=A0A6N6K9L2_9ENTR|nr:hypothetical protein [Citrobacter pasteurii]KAA1280248.1 hypothetical protein DXF85_02950 [Citrobacter pasteurii]
MYKQHTLRFEFKNKAGAFDKEGNDKITFSNIKATVSLDGVIGRTGTSASVSIYGLSLERIAELSGRANGSMAAPQNIDMGIYADDAMVFYGGMTASIANMNQAPDSCLSITAIADAELRNKAVSPFTARGAQSLTDVINAICTAAGYEAVFGDGVNGMTTSGSPHFEGSVFDQLHQVCSGYGLAMSVTPPGKAEFWPSNAQRDDVVPFISSEYGLIGYPVFAAGGVMFQTQYSSLLSIGRYIELKTEVPWASGRYQLSTVRHELSSWIAGGPWHSICTANRTDKDRQEAQSATGY